MKRSIGAHLCLLLGGFTISVIPLRADILPDEVLVVCNSQSTDALAVRDAYLAVHPDIPSASIFDLNDPTIADVADVSYSDFVTKIRDPIRAFLNSSGPPTSSDIVSIVLMRGIPHRIQDTRPVGEVCQNGMIEDFLAWRSYISGIA